MKTVSAKVTDEEYLKIKSIAKQYNISTSELIKQAVFNAEVTDNKAVKSLAQQVQKIGHNFNQIVKYTHYQKEYNPLAKSALHEVWLDIGGLLNVK